MKELAPRRTGPLQCHSFESTGYPEWLFRTLALETGLCFEVESAIARCARPLSPDCIAGAVRYWWEDDARGRTALLKERNENGRRAAILLTGETPTVVVNVAAADLGFARRIVAEIEAALPESPVSSDNFVNIGYQFLSELGPHEAVRRIEAVKWADIEANYAAATRAELACLVAMRPERLNGRLIVWHGEPGTGKTNALRALAHEWREWCRIEYVVDPEIFFASSAYMMRVIAGDDGESGGMWRVMVLEDTGEMLGSDAKQATGQGLSRLLNLADGLLGQSLRLLFLITTNERIEALQPALTRPGRCFSRVHFLKMSAEEAQGWLERSGARRDLVGSRTIAQLYAILRGGPAQEHPRAIGFRQPR